MMHPSPSNFRPPDPFPPSPSLRHAHPLHSTYLLSPKHSFFLPSKPTPDLFPCEEPSSSHSLPQIEQSAFMDMDEDMLDKGKNEPSFFEDFS